MKFPDLEKDPAEFWEELYQGRNPETNGKASMSLERFVNGRIAGTALELGCARGDDAIWLAKQGWDVTAVDISQTALDYAAQNALAAGVESKIKFERHDLSKTLPVGEFDLTSLQFLQTPFDFLRAKVLSNVARMVKSGGIFLSATHHRVAPWSWGDPDIAQPTARERLTELNVDMNDWREVFLGEVQRETANATGENAIVSDAIICIERRVKQ